MTITFYNSLTRKKEVFTPIDSNKVTMYVCGPTVYNRPHIGNVRSAVIYDQIYRLLKLFYPELLYVRNITDIDDKIIAASLERKIPMQSLTNEMTDLYNADLAEVLCLPPTVAPKATHHLDAMFQLIERLLELGHAYLAEGHIFFDITTYNKYGSFSGRVIEEMQAGVRVEQLAFKKNEGDFVLWKPSKEGEEAFSFKSPWGMGRPGWHIECSAMSTYYLGVNFDIHGGGLDLLFPHHENEIAQAVCANPGSCYAKYWLHNGFLTVKGEKMSKSANNFYLLKDLLDQGIPGPVLRYFYLTSHYRKPIDFNPKAISDAAKSLRKLAERILPLIDEHQGDLLACDQFVMDYLVSDSKEKLQPYIEHLCDDLNSPKFLSRLFEPMQSKDLAALASIIGFLPSTLYNFNKSIVVDAEVLNLAHLREEAKKLKNWTLADSLRGEILAKGYKILDQKAGSFKLKAL
jgi:cysteinyl-tRNA synthetase